MMTETSLYRNLFLGRKICHGIRMGCHNSQWSRLAIGIVSENCPEPNFVEFNYGIKDLFYHLNSECTCVTNTANLILIANDYVDKFSLMSKNVITNFGRTEFDIKNNSDNNADSKQQAINDVIQNPETNLTPFFNEKFTATNTECLLEPLIIALKYYEYALKVNQSEKYLSEQACDALKILEMFNSMFQAFTYYDYMNYAFKTTNLALRYIKKFYQNKEDQLKEDVIINYCNAVRFHLNCGFLETARKLYKTLFTNPGIAAAEVSSYGLGLKFLLYAEITLRCHKGSQIAKELKEFIQSDYLLKNTVKRFSLKAMAYFLASRFPSAFYEYSENCVEFIEPLQMAVSICRRWRLFGSFGSSNFKLESLTLDPLWYKYTVFNLINDCFDTFANFYVGTGILSDLGFYFRVVFNLNVLTLNFVGIAKMELIGANFDLYHGFVSDAKVKISLFKGLFSNSQSKPDEWVFEDYHHYLDSVVKPPKQDDYINLYKKDLTITNPDCLLASNEWDKICADEHRKLDVNFMNIYSCLVSDNKLADIYNDDNNDLDIFQSTSLKNSSNKQLWDLFVDEYSQIKVNVQQYKSIFHLFFNLVLIQIKISDHRSTDSKVELNSTQYRFFLKLLENYDMKIYLPSIQLLVKNSIQQSLNIKTSIEEQIVHGPIGSIFWNLSSIFIEPLIESGSYKEALFYLNKMVSISAYSFSDRLSRCKMFYNRALVIYYLIKTRPDLIGPNATKKIFEICSNTCPTNTVPDDSKKTPPFDNSKKNSKKIKAIPKAPTRQLFASSAVKNYAGSLLDAAVHQRRREGLEGTRQNVLDFDQENPPTSPNLFTESNDKKVVESARKQATRSTSNSTINSDNNLSNEAARDSSRSVAEDKLISNFNNILKFDSVGNFSDDDAFDEGSYFGNFFDMKLFSIETDITKISIQDLKSCLNKVINYICCHPSIDLYTKLMYLYFQLTELTMKNNIALLYFFSESFPSASFRYRAIFVANKKLALNKQYTYGLGDLEFTLKDYSWRLYDLPLNWRFVQIKVVENGTKFPDLLLCRYQNKAKTVFIKIQCNQEKMLKFFIDEFNEIMKANNSSIVEVVRETFWKLRFESDERLKLLLQNVESNWFGAFRGIFLGKCNDKVFTSACLWFKKKVLEAAKVLKLECLDSTVFDVLIESLVCLKDDEIDISFKSLFNTTNTKFITQVLELKKKYFKSWSTPEQVQKLFNDLEPVGLVLDTPLVQFPFESLPFLRELHQPFFRVPSLRFASVMYKQYKHLIENGVDHTNSFYILNPSNNLASTENFFKDTLSSINEWEGVIGQEPIPAQLADALEKKDIYLYLGHGSGSPYYRKMPDTLDGVNVNAVSIVIGCSSGRINCEGLNTELYGFSYRFLVNGAPCYVGNLWDITDKDIDTFSDHFLSYWIDKWTNQKHSKVNSLPRSLSMARDYCKLKHLIGCAPVVYGLPLTRLINKE